MISLPQYTLTRTVHEGEADVLYSGRRNSDGVPVVVKVLRGDFPNPIEIARLRHEYAILCDLDLRGVVKAYALERSERGPALVLEQLGGASLSSLLAGGPLDLATALWVASSLADTLAALHQRRVIHKDIK